MIAKAHPSSAVFVISVLFGTRGFCGTCVIGRARDPGASKSVLVRINTDGWRALKMFAIESDAILNALAVEAFNDR
jgi:hypothetical protein